MFIKVLPNFRLGLSDIMNEVNCQACIGSVLQVDNDAKKATAENGQAKMVDQKSVYYQPMKMRLIILKILKIIYIIASVIVIISAMLLIAMSALGAIVFRSYFTDSQNTRVASMIVVATCSAVGVALGAYGSATVIKNNSKTLHRISVTYIVTACALLLVGVFAVHMSAQDVDKLAYALRHSFELARQRSPRAARQWRQLQFELDCCGLQGPEDYRHGAQAQYTPDITTSCCAGYDPSLSDLLQQDMLASCRQLRTYYHSGCQEPVTRALSDAAELVYLMSVALVALFMLLGACGISQSRIIKRWRQTYNWNGEEIENAAA